MPLNFAAQIESILFFKTEPVSTLLLAKLLETSESKIVGALEELETALTDRGVVLVRHDKSVMLATHPEMATTIENLHQREIKADLSRAALETLTIILYKREVTKADLDYIRGVNSQFILRNLLIRGLVEKKQNLTDKRRSLYVPSHDTLAFLGIRSVEELPEHEQLAKELQELMQDKVELSGDES